MKRRVRQNSAWAGVTEDCVRKCFAKCCFHPVGDALPIEEESGPDDNRPDEQESAPDDNTLVLLGDVEWNDFVGMDDAIHTTAIHDDDWEAALVDKANGDVPDDEDCGDEEEGADEEEPPARPTLSARDAMSSVKDLLDFARVANDAAMIDAATSLENISGDALCQAGCHCKANHHARVLPALVDLVCHTATLHTTYSTAHVCVHMYALPCE